MSYKNFLTSVLEQTSKIARKNIGKIASVVKYEDSNQVLTQTDLDIGKLIINKIRKHYPKYNIIDEEAGIIDNDSEFTWVVDPIDGTSNFVEGIPLYGIMLGLLKEETPVAGGLALPSFDEIYVAVKGNGTFCNAEKINVTGEKELINVLAAYGIDGHQENPEQTRQECKILSEVILNIRNLRTSNSAYDVAMVAKGKYGAWLNQTTKIWDNVAQQVIIEEAGGVFTDFFGNSIDYSNALSKQKDNFTVCAASQALHKQLQKIIHEALDGKRL